MIVWSGPQEFITCANFNTEHVALAPNSYSKSPPVHQGGAKYRSVLKDDCEAV